MEGISLLRQKLDEVVTYEKKVIIHIEYKGILSHREILKIEDYNLNDKYIELIQGTTVFDLYFESSLIYNKDEDFYRFTNEDLDVYLYFL